MPTTVSQPIYHGAIDSLDLQDPPLPEADSSLMWPDSEDLFQSIFANDISLSCWQLPPGTLPLPPSFDTASMVPTATNLTNIGGINAGNAVPSGDSQHAVHGVSQMVSTFSSSLTAAVESTSITSVFLDQCLHMFFDRFVPIFPIMHRPTFVYRDCSHPLLLNAIAIGSLYLGPEDSVAKGEVLWRLAHTAMATSWQSLISYRGPHDACSGVQLVLASLLSVVYGALSRNTAIRGSSQALHASAFFWARQCGIFECKPYDLSSLPAVSAPEEQKIQQWKIWAAIEIQQRALLSHYILDGLIAHMQGNSTSVRHTSNTLKLPNSEKAFEVSSVDHWVCRMHTLQDQHQSFRDVYRQLFVPQVDSYLAPQPCSNLSLRVLLEGAQSIVADSDKDDGAIINPPDRGAIGRALSWIHKEASNCTDITEVERLEVLLRWHAVCLEAVAKTPQLCNYVCRQWSIRQGLWPNRNVREQHFDLPDFVSTAEGRKALLHAVAIQDIVEQLPRGRAHSLHMPSSLFAAATIYGVFSYAGQPSVTTPASVHWDDVVLASGKTPEGHSTTARFVASGPMAIYPAVANSRNVLYELNSVQKLFSGLATQWGIASDMGGVIGQWIAFCQS